MKPTEIAGIDAARPDKAFFVGLKPTLHIAHRGGAALAPENTLAAFEIARARYRTDMLELDVHLSRDRELIVSHDPTVDRCTNGTGAIRDLTLADLKKLDGGYRFTPDGASSPFRDRGITLPTLGEVFEAFPGLRLNIDLKSDEPGIDEIFARAVRSAGAVERICCGSEDDALAARLVQALPETCHFFPSDAAAEFIVSVKSGQDPRVSSLFQVLDLPYEFGGVVLIDRELLSAAARHRLWVNVWTVDDEETMTRLVELGVGGIMTDRPDRLRSVIDRARQRNVV